MRFFLAVFSLALLFGCASEAENEAIQMFENGNYKSALSALNEQLASNPGDTKLLFYRGRCYEELDQYDKALSDFEQIIELDEKSVDGRLGVAKIKYEQGNYQQALIAAQGALELNSNSAQGHFLEARASHMMGYFDKALDSYNTALSLNRDYGEAYLYRGAVHVQLDKMRPACEDFNKARNLGVPSAQQALSKYCK